MNVQQIAAQAAERYYDLDRRDQDTLQEIINAAIEKARSPLLLRIATLNNELAAQASDDYKKRCEERIRLESQIPIWTVEYVAKEFGPQWGYAKCKQIAEAHDAAIEKATKELQGEIIELKTARQLSRAAQASEPWKFGSYHDSFNPPTSTQASEKNLGLSAMPTDTEKKADQLSVSPIAAQAAARYYDLDREDQDSLQEIIQAAIEKAHGSLLARLDMAERARDCAYKESERYAELTRENKRLRAAQAKYECGGTEEYCPAKEELEQLRAAQASEIICPYCNIEQETIGGFIAHLKLLHPIKSETRPASEVI